MTTSRRGEHAEGTHLLEERLPEELMEAGRGHIVGAVALAVVLVAVWEAAVWSFSISSQLLPAPSAIARELWLGFSIFLRHFLVTATEVYAGFAIATVVGVGFAVLVDRSKWLRALIQPYIIGLQATPKIAMAPFLVLWFGFGLSSKIATAALITFFPIFINMLAGFSSVNPRLLELMDVLKASRNQTLVKIKLPHAMPYLFAGLEIGILLSLIGAVVGEFISSTKGLGYLILNYNFQLKTDAAFAALAMLIVLGVVSYVIVLWVKKRVVFWLGKT